jgi:formylglycine-generating enzyme required for sulfatase activity
MLRRCAKVLVVLASVLAAGTAQADVFNMPAGQTSLQFVTVGNPGNAADTAVMGDGTSGYGSVPYTYRMGEYDVTVGQYCQFLNAVAKTDTYTLYSPGMADSFPPVVGITQSGSAGDLSYSVTGGYSQAANCPIFDVTWADAARFCNWLQNGQPVYAAGTLGEVAGSTETGAYSINGALSTAAMMAVTRNSGAAYFLPSENEWYKAAYYKGGGTNAGYWTYPTCSNTLPGNTLPDTGNNANYESNGNYADPLNILTPVGDFSESPGPYGTYDMAGDVFQWNEAGIGDSNRGVRGGCWGGPYTLDMDSSARDSFLWMSEEDFVGFRVAASAPEPGDANGDGRVDINDLTIVLTNYNKTGMAWSQGDFTGDGKVDINDLTIVLTNYGYGVTAAGIQAVPEPSCAVLFAIGLGGFVAYAWRKRT